MKIRIVWAVVVVLLSVGLTQLVAADTWKVLLYIEASDGLSDMAIKNITDAMRGKPDDFVDFVIQLHAYDTTALRYQVTKSGLVFLEELQLSGESQQDVIDAARFAFDDCTADHVMLILSNHGWGILDPYWDEAQAAWITHSGDAPSQFCAVSCPAEKKRSRRGCEQEVDLSTVRRMHAGRVQEHCCHHKGFLFSVQPRVYLNNQDLVVSLAYIQSELLHGKPLDILAVDTCMGDMLEVAYQVAPYANYLVGNQSCSLRDGFDYQGVVGVLNQGLDARATTVGLVKVFDDYYTTYDKSGIFTHASLDLTQIDAVTQALDNVVTTVLALPMATELLVRARAEAPRFCLWPMYTDPVAFCHNLEAQIVVLPTSQETLAALDALSHFETAFQSCVVARCGGSTTLGKAYGTAIYLPAEGGTIDSSYNKTAFAQNSQWIKVLERLS